MRFGVLGSLAVWTSDGVPVRIRETKVRALLAQLLAHEGRLVPTDRLVDDLWGTDLPADPRSALRKRVSQLRRALDEAEPGGRELVVAQPSGYLLRSDPDAVDSERFRSVVTSARTAADPGRARSSWPRRSRSGGGPRSPTSPTSRSPPRRSRASRSSGSAPSRTTPTRGSASAPTGWSPGSFPTSWPATRCGSGCAPCTSARCTAPAC